MDPHHSEGLKVVKLYQNGIRPKGVATLIHYGLQYLKNLEILDLQDNTFTKHASLILAKALPTWKDSLFELNLNDCLLKTAGSDEVFKVFTEVKFPNLHVLKFEYNEMAQETIEVSFLPAMEKGNLPELEKLEINGTTGPVRSQAKNSIIVLDAPFFARKSAISFPGSPSCPFTHSI
nr:BPK_HP1_G0044140.mRNA.1.CDS.1 [Saccharomyces cerevisiae]